MCTVCPALQGRRHVTAVSDLLLPAGPCPRDLRWTRLGGWSAPPDPHPPLGRRLFTAGGADTVRSGGGSKM